MQLHRDTRLFFTNQLRHDLQQMSQSQGQFLLLICWDWSLDLSHQDVGFQFQEFLLEKQMSGKTSVDIKGFSVGCHHVEDLLAFSPHHQKSLFGLLSLDLMLLSLLHLSVGGQNQASKKHI